MLNVASIIIKPNADVLPAMWVILQYVVTSKKSSLLRSVLWMQIVAVNWLASVENVKTLAW